MNIALAIGIIIVVFAVLGLPVIWDIVDARRREADRDWS